MCDERAATTAKMNGMGQAFSPLYINPDVTEGGPNTQLAGPPPGLMPGTASGSVNPMNQAMSGGMPPSMQQPMGGMQQPMGGMPMGGMSTMPDAPKPAPNWNPMGLPPPSMSSSFSSGPSMSSPMSSGGPIGSRPFVASPPPDLRPPPPPFGGPGAPPPGVPPSSPAPGSPGFTPVSGGASGPPPSSMQPGQVRWDWNNSFGGGNNGYTPVFNPNVWSWANAVMNPGGRPAPWTSSVDHSNFLDSVGRLSGSPYAGSMWDRG